MAFVLSGGVSLGSIQVGMVRALDEAGIRPDLIVGTSVGALNGSWLAGGGSVDGLADVWLSLSRSDLFPLKPLHGLRAFFGKSDHFVPSNGIRRLLKRTLNFGLLEQADIEFIVLATDAQTGLEVVLDSGPALDAILASAAFPGVLPTVKIDGRVLFDGGVVNNTPISTAISAGATAVWVLSTGYSCALPEAPSSPLALALHSVALLVQQRLIRETSSRQYPVPVHLIPPPCPITVTPVDFSQTEQLMARAYAGAQQWLANGQPHAMPLHVPHRH